MRILALALGSVTLFGRAAAAAPAGDTPTAAPATVPAPGPGEPAVAAPAAEKPMLLVLPLRAEPKLAEPARALDELILDAVHGLAKYSVIGAADLNALLGMEKMKDAMSCDDTSCAAEIGGALGAPYLLAGELRSLGSQAVLSLRLMDTKKAAVIARATARGKPGGDALVKMMASTVGTCFGVEIEFDEPTTTPTPPPTPSKGATAAPAQGDVADYTEYTAFVTELGAIMSRQEYSKLAEGGKDLEARAKKVKSPAGVDAVELVVQYQALGCFMLKREACLRQAVERYRKSWPQGMYLSSVENYLQQLDDQKLAAEDAKDELRDRLAEIDAQAKKGSYDALMADELRAYAHYSAQSYAEATKLFAKLLDKLYAKQPPDVEKIMQLTSVVVMAHQQLGTFEPARAALSRAEQLDAKAYRKQGLHQTARMLPK